MRRVPTKSELDKARFLEDIGHTDESHGPVDMSHPTEEGERAALSSMRMGQQAVALNFPHCGWWWCAERDATAVRWDDLQSALATLQEHGERGIDPWSIEVAHVAGRYRLREKWDAERAGYEDLWGTLAKVELPGQGTTGDDVGSNAHKLRIKWLEELSPYLQNAREAKPAPNRKGHPVEYGDRAELQEAMLLGWTPEIVAAIFLLTGISKEPFDTLRNRLKAMHRRMTTQLRSVQ